MRKHSVPLAQALNVLYVQILNSQIITFFCKVSQLSSVSWTRTTFSLLDRDARGEIWRAQFQYCTIFCTVARTKYNKML